MWDDPFDVTADGLGESDESLYGATAPAQSRVRPAARATCPSPRPTTRPTARRTARSTSRRTAFAKPTGLHTVRRRRQDQRHDLWHEQHAHHHARQHVQQHVGRPVRRHGRWAQRIRQVVVRCDGAGTIKSRTGGLSNMPITTPGDTSRLDQINHALYFCFSGYLLQNAIKTVVVLAKAGVVLLYVLLYVQDKSE